MGSNYVAKIPVAIRGSPQRAAGKRDAREQEGDQGECRREAPRVHRRSGKSRATDEYCLWIFHKVICFDCFWIRD